MDDVLSLNEQAVDYMLQGNDQEAYGKLMAALHELQLAILNGEQTLRSLAVPRHPYPRDFAPRRRRRRQQEESPQQANLVDNNDQDNDREDGAAAIQHVAQEANNEDTAAGGDESSSSESEYEEIFLLNRDEIDMNNDHERFLYYQHRIFRRRRRRGSRNNRRRRRRRNRSLSRDQNNGLDPNNNNNNANQDLSLIGSQIREYIHFATEISEIGDLCTVINDQEICLRPFHMRARITLIQNDITVDTLETGGILLFNLACIYFRSGLLINNSSMLHNARHLYNQAYQHMQVTAAAFPSSMISFDFAILMASIAFNQCQLDMECYVEIHIANNHINMLQSAVETLEWLRYVNEQEEEVELIAQHAQTLQFFRTRLAFIRLRNLNYAPMA